MQFTKPKLLPTLLCFSIVGLLAAFFPFPGMPYPQLSFFHQESK